MNKPTIFFSHSSKDRDTILPIKEKIDTITGGTLDIFMSSDGQSIPFGRNWVHKIEEGLNSAAIMFVFVTPTSVLSNWIYFEAGFAYAKGIEVIPVGIGMNISLLKAPLNLLQGFNVVSSGSLNNFISIINKKFDYHFSDAFTDADFSDVISKTDDSNPTLDMSDIFSYAECEIDSEYRDSNGEKVILDLQASFDQIIDYLKSSNTAFSYEDSNGNRLKCILTSGIKILYQVGIKSSSATQNSQDKIKITISLYNFQTTLPLLTHIIGLIEKEWAYLWFHLNSNYAYTVSQEKTAAIIYTMQNDFEFSSSHIGRYKYIKGNLPFSIININWDLRNQPEYVLTMSYQPKATTAEDIIGCVRLLKGGKIIYKKGEHDG